MVNSGVADGLPRRTGTMLDRYQLLLELGSGGMGSVHLARYVAQGGFERLVALKLMHPHIAKQPDAVSRVLDEARLAARIHHPNVVGISDVRNSEHGPYMVMDYIEGFPLSDVLSLSGLPAAQRLGLGLRALVDAATGLHAAHSLRDERGRALSLVHRDVSPQNILVGCDGIARIIDFGVAHAARRIISTQGAMIKGKISYLAPEQARGADVDARTDVFALGIVLWEVLTGYILFDQGDANEVAVIYRILHDPIPTPRRSAPETTRALEEVCMRALAKDPEERFGSAREMVDALERAAAESGQLLSQRETGDLLSSLFFDQLLVRREAIRAETTAGVGTAQFQSLAGGARDASSRGSGTRPIERQRSALGETAELPRPKGAGKESALTSSRKRLVLLGTVILLALGAATFSLLHGAARAPAPPPPRASAPPEAEGATRKDELHEDGSDWEANPSQMRVQRLPMVPPSAVEPSAQPASSNEFSDTPAVTRQTGGQLPGAQPAPAVSRTRKPGTAAAPTRQRDPVAPVHGGTEASPYLGAPMPAHTTLERNPYQ